MQAYLEPHWLYANRGDGTWQRTTQARAVSPKTVSKIIRHALGNGWTPSKPGRLFQIAIWDAEQVEPIGADLEGGVPLRSIATEQVSELCFELSLDPSWRRALFAAPVGKRFEIPGDFYIRDGSPETGLRFAAFNAGDTEDGFVVFGIESMEFPNVVMYTTNNPKIV